jgi:hypothetical protein
MATNRTVTSREYKLMLRPDRFRDRAEGTDAYWSLVEFLIGKKQGLEIRKRPDRELRRKTWYLDTPGTELRKLGYALRARKEFDEEERFKVTLKYRHPDRYLSACQDLSCEVDCKKDKFEEDILPPFKSKFARSVAFRVDELPKIKRMGQVLDLFPTLEELDIPKRTPIRPVNGFKVHELAHQIGQIYYGDVPDPDEDPPVDAVFCCLSFWYLTGIDKGWPLTAEFSFDYNVHQDDSDSSHQLEHFGPEVVAGTNLFFRSLQKQVGWLDRSGTTKTAYAFDAL